jgi:hypothetical protein
MVYGTYTYIILHRQNVEKKSQLSKNQGFSYYFCLVMEVEESESGSALPTNESGRPKNFWILPSYGSGTLLHIKKSN